MRRGMPERRQPEDDERPVSRAARPSRMPTARGPCELRADQVPSSIGGPEDRRNRSSGPRDVADIARERLLGPRCSNLLSAELQENTRHDARVHARPQIVGHHAEATRKPLLELPDRQRLPTSNRRSTKNTSAAAVHVAGTKAPPTIMPAISSTTMRRRR